MSSIISMQTNNTQYEPPPGSTKYSPYITNENESVYIFLHTDSFTPQISRFSSIYTNQVPVS